jgi:predicted Kef-type K+ transport protein
MIGLAFILGYLVRQVGLPPLIGFLAAGFILRGAWGVNYTDNIGHVADLGVTLMLFTIGLKLKPKDLAEAPVWLGASAHMLLVVGCFLPLLMLGGLMGIPLLEELTWGSGAIVAFALAFSSTVFAVVMFQAKGETNAAFAKVSIGILIMQDIFAVIFLTASKGEIPSLWAIPMVATLIAMRKPLGRLLERSGHGELLILSGLLLPLAAYEVFELVKLKGDLGALLLGVLLASSAKADELSKQLFSVKEFLLVTFFLSIGLRGDPTFDIVLVSVGLLALLPIKFLLFYGILTRLNLPARPAAFATFSLGNYSEFGLIVGALAVGKGWLPSDWLLVFALSLAMSYLIASPITMGAEKYFERFARFLHRFERESSKPPSVYLGEKRILIIGLGRMGSLTVKQIESMRPHCVIALDFDRSVVDRRREEGLTCIHGDGTDLEFWQRVDLDHIEAVLITMPNHLADVDTVRALRESGYRGFIGVSIAHDDEGHDLLEAGADTTYGVYGAASEAFSDIVLSRLSDAHLTETAIHRAIDRRLTNGEFD